MLFNKMLNYIFNSPVAINVIRELDLRKKGITGRETARITGITHRSALNVLYNLEMLKIVKKEPVGRAYYFTLNRNHYLYINVIEPSLSAERNYKRALFDLVKRELKNHCESVIVFGSVARGNETLLSDFDICIVYSANKKIIDEKVSDLRIKTAEVFGTSLAPLMFSTYEIKKESKHNKTLIKNITEEGKVIYGKTIGELVNG